MMMMVITAMYDYDYKNDDDYANDDDNYSWCFDSVY